MSYLLDSNAVIMMLRGHAGLLGRMRQHPVRDFALPVIVVHELFFGAFRGQRRAENLAKVEALPFAVLEFDREDARHAGEIRATLAASGQAIGPYEVLIAGQTRARGMTLITHNLREFRRVPELRVEDWQVE